ncbi:hypothetical protein [Aequorivita capsosiphonis]|uniref:hypothetical protein n=1 Tax=Aequorivita capsosiphonis TaxID=487317 RepID=UPI00041E6BFE|nr:hypothetical protein [Aequorivita capsosiphonis]
MEKDVIAKISNINIPMAEVIQYLLKKYPDNFTLNLFYRQLQSEIEKQYSETLLRLTDKEILFFIKFYIERNWDLPKLKINEEEYRIVKYFIRNVNQYKVISNAYNIGSDDADYMEVINLNEIVLKHHESINFLHPFSLEKEMEQIGLLQKIKIYLEEYLNINKNQQTKTKPELTLKQVALLYIYNGDHITRENGNSIAEKFGHTSGEKLYQNYNKYALSTDRNSSDSKTKDRNLLKDIEKVISYLPKAKQENPKGEAERLRNTIQNNDYLNL